MLAGNAYVVASPYWNGMEGAVTWSGGASGISGTISSSNSLIGSSAGDQVGGGGITVLPSGNYVIISPTWSNYTGAVTWANGTTGITGTISSANSLVGSTGGGIATGDYVGSDGVTVLANGNYLVAIPDWNGGSSTSSYGAVTWGSGTSGIAGVVSSSNSLVGSNNGDRVGLWEIVLLSNGNYVVPSPFGTAATATAMAR